jgi:hypothetical protein
VDAPDCLIEEIWSNERKEDLRDQEKKKWRGENQGWMKTVPGTGTRAE